VFLFYDLEVFRHDWLAVLMDENGSVIRIHNDVDKLKNSLSTQQILVGFNNYSYDDVVLAGILSGKDPFELSQKIMNGDRINATLEYLTLDTMQELNGLSLKEIQANLGQNIHETPIDFNIDRPLTPEEIEEVFQYCENDVRTTKKVFELREDYFISKFEIVDTFKLPVTMVKKTRANLAAAVLQAKKTKQNDPLNIHFDKRIPLHELPAEIVSFYTNIKRRFWDGEDPRELEREKLEFELAGIKHTYGFGGLHGAIENYVYNGPMMQIDVSSFYPTLMINNDFISRGAGKPELYRKIYDERLRLKKEGNSKHEIYKILLNAAFGGMKNEYNPLYDPQMFNNVVINGQLILTHLILLLQPFTEQLIQSNTDGIIIAYDPDMKDAILDLLDRFAGCYELKFDVKYITKIAQRDVNNYVVKYENGEIKAKGRMANFDGGDWERNSLHIIDRALVNYYMHNIPVQRTVIDAFKTNRLDLFQLVAKAGKFDGMAHEMDGKMVELQKVNRIFATTKKNFGGVYKVKDYKFHKTPFTSDHCIVWNDDLKKLDKRLLDLNFYIQLVKENLFT